MRLEFKKPITPNFIRTKNAGVIKVQDLSINELKEYMSIWYSELLKKHRK